MSHIQKNLNCLKILTNQFAQDKFLLFEFLLFEFLRRKSLNHQAPGLHAVLLKQLYYHYIVNLCCSFTHTSMPNMIFWRHVYPLK